MESQNELVQEGFSQRRHMTMKTGAVLTAVVGGFMSTMAMAALQPDELDSKESRKNRREFLKAGLWSRPSETTSGVP